MKKRITGTIASILLIQAISFCQQNPIQKYIPDSAAMIMSFNPVKVFKKIPGESFRQSFFYRELMKKDNADLKAFMADPSVSGINPSNDLVLVIGMNSGTGFSPAINIMGSLKDETLFSRTVNKLKKETDSIHVYGTNKMLYSEQGIPSIAWNNEVFVVSTSNSSGLESEKQAMSEVFSDTNSTSEQRDKKIQEVLRRIYKKKRDMFFTLLTPNPTGAMSSNSTITELLNADGDFKTWSNGKTPNALLMGRPNPITELMSRIQPMMGNSKSSVTSFENGKIITRTQVTLNSKMAELYKNYTPPAQNTDLFRRLPKGKLLGVMSTSFNTSLGKQMIQESGLKEMLDSLKSKLPFDPESMTNVFGNNMILAAVQSDDYPEADSFTKKMGGIQIVMAMPIANKERFDNLKSSMTHLWDSLRGTETAGKIMKNFQPAIKYNDKLMVFSLSPYTATAFLNSPGTEPVPEWVDELKNHSMVMSLNMHDLFGMLLGKKISKLGPDGEKMLGMFDKMVSYGGDYENGSIRNTMEMRFSNQSENALKQLFDMMNYMAEMSSKREDRGESEAVPNDGVKVEEVKIEEMKTETPPPPPPPPAQELRKKPVKKTKGH